MASSMLTGERRWVSARRGGMTVLGKVAVPKPVNLPSQRLENHGLDPNVEIVPKDSGALLRGTLSWGSRSSSSAPNAWGSSSLSFSSSEEVAGSPSRLNRRPSSGGSGTRPSTAGSDISYEPTPNAWGPNSRPSSSSGALASSQTSTVTTRPRSAETRPGSSQLSRFAELSENSVAWGALGTAEKLGVGSSKVNGFTLSTGDFPTLGSDKNSESPERQGHSSQGRPVSASGRVSTLRESSETSPADHEHVAANAKGETVNTWTSDKSSYLGDGAPHSMEKWQRDPQPFPNTNMPPHHLGPWHGTPVRHSSDGVWYRGPPGGPPYGTPGPPGSYPLEPFNYYHPQIPPRPVPNSQMVPRPGAGPNYHHQKNADSYRPQIPESFIRPMMPIRPGVYPGMVSYEGYYGPPRMAMCNSSDRDAHVLGMAAGHCVYNRYPNQNLHHDSGNFHARSGGYGSTSTTMVKEQVEDSHSYDTQRGPYKVLLKQQDGWVEKDREEKWGHGVSTNAPLDEGQQPRAYGEGASVTDHRLDKAVNLSKTAFDELASPQPTDNREGSSVPIGMGTPGSISNTKAVNESLAKKGEPAPTPGGPQQFTATKRNPSLIDKIECLNTKARISDGRYDGCSISSKDEKMKRSRVVSADVDSFMKETLSGAASAQKTYMMGRPILSSQESGTNMRDKILEQKTSSGTAIASPVGESQASVGNVLDAAEVGEKKPGQIHKRVQGVEGRVDNQVKGRFTNQDGEEWRKKPPVAKSSTIILGANMETSEVNMQVFHAPQEASEKSDLIIHGSTGGECATSSFDPNNYNAQRAKMKEIATQRAKQLQIEEEERIREQKAKALAKLEELNRRTQAENSFRKLENSVPMSGSIQQKQEDPRSHVDTSYSGEAQDSANGLNSSAFAQDIDRLGGSTNLSKDLFLDASKCAPQDSVELPNSSVPLQQDVNYADAANPKPAQPAQVQENISIRQRQMGQRKKLNNPSEKSLSEGPTPTGSNGALRSHVNVVPDVNALNTDSGMPNNASSFDDQLPPQRRKTHRNGRSKHKLDETLSGALAFSTSAAENPAKVHLESAKTKASESVLEVLSVHCMTSRESLEVQDCQNVPSADQGWSLSTEEGSIRSKRNGRSKQKVDGTLSGVLPLPMSTEENPTKVHIESPKAKASKSVLEVSSVPVATSRESVEVQDCQSIPSADQGWSMSTEEADSRSINQWRSQPRRMPRNQQATRSADKLHGGEAVVWAPVRSQNKNDVSEEVASHCTTPESNASVTKNGQGMQSNMTKGKRAEMERYVPKPVAKEMLQHGNTERPSPPKISQSVCDEAPQRIQSGSQGTETGGPDGLATGKSGTVVDPKNVGSRHNKHGKAHGSWRQRGPPEPAPVQGLQEGSSLSSGNDSNAYKPIGQHQPEKTETCSPKGPAKYSNHWTSNNSVSTDLVASDLKEHNVTARGKRHPFKGHKGAGHNHNIVDQKDVHLTDKIDAQTSALEMNQPEGRVALRENHIGEHSTSHWQPKSQPHVAHNQQGNRGNGGQKVMAQVSRTSEKEFTQPADGHTSQNKDNDPFLDQPQPQPHQSETLKTNFSQGSIVRSREAKKERKGVDSFKERAFSPDQVRFKQSELSPANVNTQHEQQLTSGLRRHVHPNGRFSGVQESHHAGRNPAGQDSSKQHHVPGNGDRKRHNLHYEYQAVRSHNNKLEDSCEGAADGSHVMGSRYRERGQNHSRRRGGGNFYARSSGTIHVADGSGDGE